MLEFLAENGDNLAFECSLYAAAKVNLFLLFKTMKAIRQQQLSCWTFWVDLFYYFYSICPFTHSFAPLTYLCTLDSLIKARKVSLWFQALFTEEDKDAKSSNYRSSLLG